ncbi:hypothetical protein D3C75_1004300 [compost metagenome]
MALRSVAVILIASGAEIICRIFPAAKIGCVDLAPPGQDELSEVIMVMRLSIVAALGSESERARFRHMPRNQPCRIGKIAARGVPSGLPDARPSPEQIAERRSKPAAVIFGVRRTEY